MQKRKYKLNALDIAIFIVVLCSVAVIMFRDSISGFLGTTEISMIDITLTIENDSSSQSALISTGKPVVFEPESSTDIKADALVKKSIESTESENSATEFVITCTGYKKFGRFYTENGDRISIGEASKITIDETDITCKVVSVTLG